MLPTEPSNAKFSPILVLSLSMSATFCLNPSDDGRTIFAHLAMTSSVAKRNVMAYPSLISKPTRTSRITLQKVRGETGRWNYNVQAAIGKFFRFRLGPNVSQLRIGEFV